MGRPFGFWGEKSVLSSDGKNQRSPGNGSGERLRGAGAHSYLFPGPLFTGAYPFGFFVASGGLSFDRAIFYSRALGPFAIKICKFLLANVHRLLHPYLLGAVVVGRTSCHGFASVGSVISTHLSTKFCT